jgi:MarR family transcriptional repressor of emrRAB
MCVLHILIYRAKIQAVKRYPEHIVSTLRTANLLGALAGEVSNRLERLLKHHPNQTDSAAAALNTIALYEGCSNTQLSRTLRLSHPATVRLVDKLEAEGAVERRDADDKRAVALYLTRRGRARAKDLLVSRCEALRDIVNPLSIREREQLSRLLEKLLRPLVTIPQDGDYICRLCDSVACPPNNCPVHQAAVTLAAE